MLLIATGGPTLAQDAASGPARAAGGEAAAQREAPDLTSPRATIQTFYEAMVQVQAGVVEDLDRALACLYLEEIPEAERQQAGFDLAQRLFAVLESVTFALESIPEEVEGPNYVADLGGEAQVQVTLRLNDDGAWRFSHSQTLAQLDDILEEVAEADAETDAVVQAEFDERLRSPRDTMRIFLAGFKRLRDDGMAEVLTTLDLSGFDINIREQKGRQLAVFLKKVMDRDKYVELNNISKEPTASPYIHLTSAVGSIVIAPVVLDEETGVKGWQFTAETLASATSLWDDYRTRPLAAGVVDNTPHLYSIAIRDWIADHAPFLLKESILLENWQWLGLFFIIFIGMLVSRLIAYLLMLIIRRWFSRRKFEIGSQLEAGFVKPIRVALMAWVWLLGLGLLVLPPEALEYLVIAAKLVSATGLLWAVYRLVDIITKYITERAAHTASKFDDILVALVSRTLKVFVIASGVVLIFSILGQDPSTVLAGLGLGGLAFALAAKDSIANFFGSMTVVLDRPFQIGDWINVRGVDGSVEAVGVRSTRVRTFYNSLITIPNSELVNSPIDNYGMRRYRRIKTTLGLTYDTSPEKVEAFCEGVRELIRQHPYTRKDYFHVYLNDFSASSIDVMLYCFVETPDWGTELRERERLLLDIMRLAQNLGVEFAFPTQTLYMRKEDKPEMGPFQKSRPQAFDIGRDEASRIIRETYGNKDRKPPPVTFGQPDGIEGDLRDISFGDDDGGE
jgi:MscS family membrane protein